MRSFNKEALNLVSMTALESDLGFGADIYGRIRVFEAVEQRVGSVMFRVSKALSEFVSEDILQT